MCGIGEGKKIQNPYGKYFGFRQMIVNWVVFMVMVREKIKTFFSNQCIQKLMATILLKQMGEGEVYHFSTSWTICTSQLFPPCLSGTRCVKDQLAVMMRIINERINALCAERQVSLISHHSGPVAWNVRF